MQLEFRFGQKIQPNWHEKAEGVNSKELDTKIFLRLRHISFLQLIKASLRREGVLGSERRRYDVAYKDRFRIIKI